jgi:hypothetical protein
MIRDRLMEINQTEVWNSDKLEKTEAFIKEFAMGFVAWLDKNKKKTNKILLIDELLKIYENENRR